MSDEKQGGTPDIPPGHPASAGMHFGVDNLAGASASTSARGEARGEKVQAASAGGSSATPARRRVAKTTAAPVTAPQDPAATKAKRAPRKMAISGAANIKRKQHVLGTQQDDVRLKDPAATSPAPEEKESQKNNSTSYGPKAVSIGTFAPVDVQRGRRQAPESANKPAPAKEDRGDVKTTKIENSIEPSAVRKMSAQRQPEPHELEMSDSYLTASSTKRTGFGNRLVSNMGRATQMVGAWLAIRGRNVDPTTKAGLAPLGKMNVSGLEAVPGAAIHDKSAAVPEAVARRFLKVEQEYLFPNRTPAFSDYGNKLATRGTNPEVVRSLIEIAKARGWDNITLKGTDEFRRSAWMEAAQNGLEVVGYQPTPLDLAELARRPERNSVEKGLVKEKSQTSPQPGDASTIRERQVYPMARVPTETKSEQEMRKLSPDPELAKKAKAFEENKPSFVVKKYPDLVGAYGIVEAAKAFASERLLETAREEFIGMARRHVMQKIITGDAVVGPKIYMAQQKVPDTNHLSKARDAGSGLGATPRPKGFAKER